jgi:type I restriction enzyme M protein
MTDPSPKLGLEVEDRRSQASHVEAILKANSTPFGDVLRLLTREDLKAICEALGLDTAGKEKEPIVQRILAADSGGAARAPAAAAGEQEAPRAAKRAKANGSNGGDLGFEGKLFQAADKLGNNMDAAEYKHVVLGLIFLKYISDAFGELHARQGRVAEPSLPARSRRPSGPGMLTGPKRAHLVLLGFPHTPPLF